MAQTFLLRKRDDKNHYKISKKLHYCVVLIFFFQRTHDVKMVPTWLLISYKIKSVYLLKEGMAVWCSNIAQRKTILSIYKYFFVTDKSIDEKSNN